MGFSGRTITLFLALLPWTITSVAAPTVSMTAPSNGALYLAPGTLPVKANASAPGVGVQRVEFYANGNLIFTDTTSPYQLDWSGVAAGVYAITAKAIDNNGAETTSAPRTITVAGTNTPPTVSLSAPADNARYLNPSSVTLTATAAGPELNDILQKVELYLNGSLAQTITQTPWSYAATGLAPGSYVLTAVATDSQGAQTTSSQRTFVVSNTNAPPTVSLVIPMDNSLWHAPATVTFQAAVNSGEANDTVSVEFFANGASIGTRSSPPFSLSTNLSANTYTVSAVATDGQGAQTTSTTRTVTVSAANAAPVVSVTSPAANANYPSAPAGFTFNATAGAGEINGWIQRVEFYVNGSLVNTDTAGPWSYAVSGLANGTYLLTAKAVDQLGAETTTAPITITVGPNPKLHFIHVDHLNTPRAIYDEQQQLRWKWEQTEAFGDSVPDENPSGFGAFEFALRFPGQYLDKESNRAYNFSRNYDMVIGRYVESDAIGLRGGLNTYLYVGAYPLGRVDPTGEVIPLLLGMTAIVGAGNLFLAAYNFQLSTQIQGNLANALANARNACAAGIQASCASAKQLERELYQCGGGIIKSSVDLVDQVGSGGRYPDATDVIKQITKK
jgi:RHS repeat-associated protein